MNLFIVIYWKPVVNKIPNTKTLWCGVGQNNLRTKKEKNLCYSHNVFNYFDIYPIAIGCRTNCRIIYGSSTSATLDVVCKIGV